MSVYEWPRVMALYKINKKLPLENVEMIKFCRQEKILMNHFVFLVISGMAYFLYAIFGWVALIAIMFVNILFYLDNHGTAMVGLYAMNKIIREKRLARLTKKVKK